METFTVYILYSRKADRYYVGHSNDITRRLMEHNDWGASPGKYGAKKRAMGIVLFGTGIDSSCGGDKTGETNKVLEKQKNDRAVD